MRFLCMFLMKTFILGGCFGACRIISMTFRSFSRTITIKNRKLASLLIAYKNTWGISTSPEKRNKMALAGVLSYIVLLPQFAFLAYSWPAYTATGSVELCSPEKTYHVLAGIYYIIALLINISEANKFNKGELW